VVFIDALGGVGCYSWVVVHSVIMNNLAKRALSGGDVTGIIPSALWPLSGGYAHPIGHLWCSSPKVRHYTFPGLGDDLLPSRLGLPGSMVTPSKKIAPNESMATYSTLATGPESRPRWRSVVESTV
jgi:hypothetical protein